MEIIAWLFIPALLIAVFARLLANPESLGPPRPVRLLFRRWDGTVAGGSCVPQRCALCCEENNSQAVRFFHDYCREAYASRGARGLPSVWCRSVLDLVANAPQERVVELTAPPLAAPRTLTRCTFCSEEIIGSAEKCLYCGAKLSLPLSTATVPRAAEHQGSFAEDTPESFITGFGAPPF